jgi:Mg/Co/Ni transporter MgtE
MIRQPNLTLAYLSHAPRSAAQVLQQIESAQAAAFLAQVPVRLTAPLLSEMSPWSGARIVADMPIDQAVGVLAALDFDDCLALVRLMVGERQTVLLEQLPSRLGRRLRHALNYPAGSVGAWIDPQVPAFPEQTRVQAVLDHVADTAAASHVFVQAETDGRFLGAIAISQLVGVDTDLPLTRLPLQSVRPLSSRATLASVLSRREWDQFLVLPVVGRSKSMVGGLSRSSLRRGLNERRDSAGSAQGSMLGQLVSALAISSAGLLQALAQGTTMDNQEKSDDQRG